MGRGYHYFNTQFLLILFPPKTMIYIICFNVSMWPVLVLHFHFEVLKFPALASMSVTLPINQCTSSNSPPSLPTKCGYCHSPHPIQKSLVVVGHCCYESKFVIIFLK